ncbi:unnamed protein product [Chrysoparadoxa australica]
MVKRKRPKPVAPPPVRSLRKARKITTAFHKLTHEREGVENDASLSEAQKCKQLARLDADLQQLGGRQVYQQASVISVKFHDTSKWVTQQLTQLGLRPGKGQAPLRVLEVGAINDRLLNIPWMAVRAIDINSMNSRIEETDFFDLKPAAEFAVVVSSMVLNCVGTPKRRGEMLVGYRQHLKDGGYLFLMLPLLCLTNSHRMSVERFEGLLKRVGFTIQAQRSSPKVAFYCLQATHPGDKNVSVPTAKRKARKARNDFAVHIP